MYWEYSFRISSTAASGIPRGGLFFRTSPGRVIMPAFDLLLEFQAPISLGAKTRYGVWETPAEVNAEGVSSHWMLLSSEGQSLHTPRDRTAALAALAVAPAIGLNRFLSLVLTLLPS
jgi:hypothetical protein